MTNERDNALAYGNTALADKLTRQLGDPPKAEPAAVKRAAAAGGDRKAEPKVQAKPHQTRDKEETS